MHNKTRKREFNRSRRAVRDDDSSVHLKENNFATSNTIPTIKKKEGEMKLKRGKKGAVRPL